MLLQERATTKSELLDGELGAGGARCSSPSLLRYPSLAIDAEPFDIDLRPAPADDVGDHLCASAGLRPAVRSLADVDVEVGDPGGAEIRRSVRRHRTQARPGVGCAAFAGERRLREQLAQTAQHGRGARCTN